MSHIKGQFVVRSWVVACRRVAMQRDHGEIAVRLRTNIVLSTRCPHAESSIPPQCRDINRKFHLSVTAPLRATAHVLTCHFLGRWIEHAGAVAAAATGPTLCYLLSCLIRVASVASALPRASHEVCDPLDVSWNQYAYDCIPIRAL